MGVPYLGKALRGWTRKITFKTVVKSIVDHVVTKSETDIILDANLQPMPTEEVNKKPAEERSWKWWSLIVKEGQLLNTNDRLTDPNGKTFTIMKRSDWTESGFQKYEAVEDFGT